MAQIAVEELRAETGDDSYKFVAVRLPYGVQADEEDAQRALKFIQPDVSLVVNIKEGVDGQVRELEKLALMFQISIKEISKHATYDHTICRCWSK